jgi:hypothetical protein
MGPEAALEARCSALARSKGCYAVKLGGFTVGLPDRVFLLPKGKVWLVEFKSPTGAVTQRQRYTFTELAGLGHPVDVIRTAAAFANQLSIQLGEPVQPPPRNLGLDLP